MRFDSSAFLHECFGDHDGLVRLMTAYAFPSPNVAAARKWFERERIPAAWLPLLIAAITIEKGAPVDLNAYLTDH